MAYNKTNWKDTIKDASGNVIEKGTPLAAQHLNKMESGIENATQNAEKAVSDLAVVSQQLADTEQKKADREELKVTDARIDNLVANAGDTDGNAELLDLRVGADGETYTTAGEALRTTIPKLNENSERKPFEIVVDGSDLSLEWKGSEATGLDDETELGMSYQELFIDKNAIPNGHFDNDMTGFNVPAGTPTISSTTYNTPSKGLNVSGTTSQQVRTTLPVMRKYYIALKVRVDRYVSGYVGFLTSRTDNPQGIGARGVTEGFVTYSQIVSTNDPVNVGTIVIGSISGANADAFIDDVVAIDITDITSPAIETMDRMYEEYLRILKGESTLRPIVKSVSLNSGQQQTLDDKDAGITSTYQLSKENNDLYIHQTTNPQTINLDTQTKHGVTYRELFETRNFIKNSHFDNGLDGFNVPAGAPTVTSEVYNTPSNSLKLFGTTSQQVRLNPPGAGTKYYVALMVRVDRYVAGTGMGYLIGQVDYPQYNVVSAPTDGFVKLSGVYTVDPAYQFSILTIGSLTSANMDGYIDDVVAVDITDLPDSIGSDLDGLYEDYLNIKKGNSVKPPETHTYKIGEFHKPYSTLEYSEGYTAFMSKLNEKAQEIGMRNTSMSVPFSYDSTAYDMLKAGVQATGYNELMKVWGRNSYSYNTKGVDPRLITVETTVTNAFLESSYSLFGGKTGSGNGLLSIVFLANAPNGNMFVGAIAGNTTERFTAAKNMLDIATARLDDPSYTPPVEITDTIDRGAITTIPAGNPFSYLGYDHPLLFSKNENELTSAASTAKTMTAMLALDYITDVNERVVITPDDLRFSEAWLKVGDSVRFRDLLHVMMLPSSNNAAVALARHVGVKILETR